jgi:homoserine acetyltransferase
VPYALDSEFGHDAFLIEDDEVGAQLRRLLDTRV